VFIDKYLDVVFTIQGDLIIDDRDELDNTYQTGELSDEQYYSALKECDLIIHELCSDIAYTKMRFSKILYYVNSKIRDTI
jgi:predicted RNA-binding protein associated with RNAse of E/G family